MNPIEALLTQYKEHIQLSLLVFSSVFSPALVDQIYFWVFVTLYT